MKHARKGSDRQTDRRTDGRTDGRRVCRSEEWHTLHTITPNKWPKHQRKNLRKIRNGAWAYIVLRGCQTNALPSYVYQENIIFKWSKEKGDFFSLSKMCLTLMCISLITRVVFILGYFFVKECCTKRPQEGLRIKWYTAALSATLLT